MDFKAEFQEANLMYTFCQTPVLGLGQGVDFTFASDNNNNNNDKDKKQEKNPPKVLERNGTRG